MLPCGQASLLRYATTVGSSLQRPVAPHGFRWAICGVAAIIAT